MSEEFNALINPPGLLYLPLLLKMSLGVNGSFALNVTQTAPSLAIRLFVLFYP